MREDVYAAADIAAELRRRLPGVGTKKVHKLLYYCQGHHLADLGRPLFTESIAAWDMGPVVGRLWKQESEHGVVTEGRRLDEAALNTVGYVVSRYGRLSGRDLEILAHGEQPWKAARDRGEQSGDRSSKLTRGELISFFTSSEDAEEPTDRDLPAAEVDRVLRDARERSSAPAKQDDLARLRRRLEQLKASKAIPW